VDASIAPELAALLAEADALRRLVVLDAEERERERQRARASESEKTGQLTDELRGATEQALSLLALLVQKVLVSSYKTLLAGRAARRHRAGTQFTCFTSTKVLVSSYKTRLAGRAARRHRAGTLSLLAFARTKKGTKLQY
jgi:hypothetical protein